MIFTLSVLTGQHKNAFHCRLFGQLFIFMNFTWTIFYHTRFDSLSLPLETGADFWLMTLALLAQIISEALSKPLKQMLVRVQIALCVERFIKWSEI